MARDAALRHHRAFPARARARCAEEPAGRREKCCCGRLMSIHNDWIDISVPLHNGMVTWPGDAPFERLPTLQISTGAQCNLSQISTTTHIGTHMDAPLHYLPGG